MDKTPAERVSQALLWLGFEDVEIGKRFSANKFQNNEKNVIEAEIRYSNKDDLIPKTVTELLIKFMENVINYHNTTNKSKIDSSDKE